MKRYIVHNPKGKILRGGTCPDEMFKEQAGPGEFVLEGIANDVTQKIVNDKVVNKTLYEIEQDNPTQPEVSPGKRPSNMTNEQWQDVLNRLSKLEAEIKLKTKT